MATLGRISRLTIPPQALAPHPGRLDEVAHHDVEAERTGDPEHARRVDEPGEHDEDGDGAPDGRDHDEGQHDGRYGQERIVDAAQHGIEPATPDGGRDAQGDPHEVGQQGGDERDTDGGARPEESAGERIPAQVVGAEPRHPARGLEVGSGIGIVAPRHDEERLVEDVRLVVGGEVRTDDDDGRPEHHHADPQLPAPGKLQPAPGRRVGELLEPGCGARRIPLFHHAGLSRYFGCRNRGFDRIDAMSAMKINMM